MDFILFLDYGQIFYKLYPFSRYMKLFLIKH